MQIDQADFLHVFQKKEILKPGELMFSEDLRTTSSITVSTSDGLTHQFDYDIENGLWTGSQPWNDRADGPKVINQLILFALNAEVQESLEIEKAQRSDYGFKEERIAVTFRNSIGKEIANFSIGSRSAWKKRIDGKQPILVPTVYLRHNGSGQRNTLYLCTDLSGDIRKYFDNELEAFRDHRPFAKNFTDIKQVRLKRSNTEITLSHDQPRSPWLITKPLELDTDRKATMAFLKSLSQLTAVKLHSTADLSLPEVEENELIEISISDFSTNDEVTLTVYPAAEDATTTYATVSDRDVIFELPLIATPSVSNHITQLPESVNALRSRNMIRLNKKDRAQLKSLIIRSPQSQPIIISRSPGQPYQLLKADNTKMAIDEGILGKLLATLATVPVKDFASDAATDFSPYGLDQPLLIIDLLSYQAKPKQLRIGKVQAAEGEPSKYFANLRGTPIIWEISSTILTAVPKQSWEWKPKLIWSLPIIDIIAFSSQRRGDELLEITYDYMADSFTAKRGETELTTSLNPQRAKFFLNENHQLIANKRLGPYHKAASEALQDPIYTTAIRVQQYDAEGMPAEIETYSLALAKVANTGANRFYYAKASNQDDFLLLDLDTVRKLAATDLFDE